MSNNEDIFENLREGLSQFGKKVTSFVDDVFSSGEGGDSEEELRVRADVYTSATSYVIELELPGIKKQEVSIQIHDGVLLIKGEKRAPEGSSAFSYEKQERRFGSFHRAFPLPADVDMNSIKARYDDGMLTVRLSLNNQQADDSISID
ncbi:MAG: Hsp20/alpha crystallin family protein [Bacteroidia bacterium]